MANISGAVAPQPNAGSVKAVTTASFRADVLTASTRQPVLVDFWAPWCGPCKQLAPALEKAVADAGGKVALVKMNIDEHPQIAGQLGIQSIPAVIAFDKGQPVDGFVGALPESQIRGFIERLVGPIQSESAVLLAEADEAAANGDAANKIGTYGVALMAHAHGIPFYVAAPSSTFDLSLPDGNAIPIEQRDPAEVTHGFGKQTAPTGVKVYNPAFDVTPARLIAGLITEKGVIAPVTAENIRRVLVSSRT